MAIIGIDIGGTHFRIGLVDSDGSVSDFQKIPVKQVFSTENAMGDLSAYLKDYCQGKPVEAISIGFPATLDTTRKRVLQAPNVPGMENLPVVDLLSRELGVPVVIERDVTMALFYDCRALGIAQQGIICGFYFGTGVGNAICVGGRPLVGRHGTAGELGHIPVDGNEIPCGCGNEGCIETLAGGKYLAKLRDARYPDTPIGDLFVKHGDAPELRQFVDRMAMAVATEINILDPDRVLIGGGVPAMAEFPKSLLLERIYHRARKPYPAEDLQMEFVSDREEKAVIGAALYAMEQIGK